MAEPPDGITKHATRRPSSGLAAKRFARENQAVVKRRAAAS
jgi:hypothetical protein